MTPNPKLWGIALLAASVAALVITVLLNLWAPATLIGAGLVSYGLAVASDPAEDEETPRPDPLLHRPSASARAARSTVRPRTAFGAGGRARNPSLRGPLRGPRHTGFPWLFEEGAYSPRADHDDHPDLYF